jgi:hypothetical protein
VQLVTAEAAGEEASHFLFFCSSIGYLPNPGRLPAAVSGDFGQTTADAAAAAVVVVVAAAAAAASPPERRSSTRKA